jgi:hypothetical protein
MAVDQNALGLAATALNKSKVALEVLKELLEGLEHGKVLDNDKREELLAKVKAVL